MDKIKIWTIEGSQASPVQQMNQIDSEKLLEEIMVKKPELLMPGLTLVGRQTQTEGGPLDLLGVDSDGRLVVFELKRGTLYRDAVAQIIDYAASLKNMELDDLVNHISDNSGKHRIKRIDDFKEWYIKKLGFDSLDSLRPLRMFLVGLDVDDTTERMVNFLAQEGLDISLLIFYGFEQDGKVLLARHDDSWQGTRTKRSQGEFKDWWDSNNKKYGVSDLFNTVVKMFRKNWPNSLERYNQWGLNFRLKNWETDRFVYFARIGSKENKLVISFCWIAIKLCVNEFNQFITEIPFETWPQRLEDLVRNKLHSALNQHDGLEIQFQLTKADWEIQEETLNGLTRAVYDAQQSKL